MPKLFWPALAAAIVSVVMVNTAPALALSTQGYTSTEKIAAGSLVSTVEGKTGSVEAANADRAGRLLGVVVEAADAVLNVSVADTEIQVATTETVSVLVSTVNGDIKAGDYIAPTYLTGIGGKAVASGQVIGTAQSDFNEKTTGAKKQTVTPPGGQAREVTIAQIPVRLGVTTFTAPETNQSVVPKFLQELANSVAGKQVSSGRVIIAGAIMLIAVIAVSALLYGATRSSITSIGRNPLSKSAVQKGLIQVFLLVMLILAAALTAVYFIFKS